MSAYSVGAQVSTRMEGGTQPAEPTSSAPAAFVKWIPGEAITFYAALLGLGATQGSLTGNETPQALLERIDAGSSGWFFVGAALSAGLVLLGALTAERPQGSQGLSIGSLGVRIALALVSFLIWTTALPGAWPYGWDVIRDMGAAYALLLVPVAAVFSGVAEFVTRKSGL